MSDPPKSCHQVKMSHFLTLSALKHASDACVCVLQEKQSEMERLKEQLVELEKQRDELNNTIGKLRQVKLKFQSGGKYQGFNNHHQKWRMDLEAFKTSFDFIALIFKSCVCCVVCRRSETLWMVRGF